MKGFTLVILLLLGACTYPDHARMALESAGDNDVVITGYRNGGCADNELYPAGFEATKDSKWVSGVVCTGPESGPRILHEYGGMTVVRSFKDLFLGTSLSSWLARSALTVVT